MTVNVPVTVPVEIPEMDDHKLDRIERMVEFMLTHPVRSVVVSVSDIAQMEKVSASCLRKGGKYRYLLPRFGQSAYPHGVIRWTMEEYLSWSARDPFEREAEYREHLRNVARRKAEALRKSQSSGRP